MSCKAYATKVGVNAKSLTWWKWQLAKRDRERATMGGAGPLTFVEVSSTATTDDSVARFEVELVSGTKVHVPAAFDDGALGRLLDVLERRS